MPPRVKELTPTQIKGLKHPGGESPVKVAVGGVSGLHIQIWPSGAKSWVLRTRYGDWTETRLKDGTIQRGRKKREIGFGPYPDVLPGAARDKTREAKVVDAVHGRKGNPAAITADYAKVLKSYGVFRVAGDRYAGAWVPTEYSRRGVTYEPAPGTRSEMYASFAPALNSGVVDLPPCDVLERQLVALERKTTRGGRDIIDHACGAHDDRANAVAGVAAELAKRRSDQVFGLLTDGDEFSPRHRMAWAGASWV